MSPTAAEVVAGWKVWCPDLGWTENDAIFYHAEPTASTANPWMRDFKEAAEHYAEEHCSFTDDPFENIEIYVRDTLTLEVYAVTVTVEHEPVFRAAIWVTPR